MSDPLDRAMNAQPRPRSSTIFGQLEYDVWDCVLQKGMGKVPFDPQQHKEDDLRTAIDMSVVPLPGSPLKHDIVRNLIAESDEWAKVILPSLKAIGADLRKLKGAWVQVNLVPTGRKYTNQQGEEKEASTFSFVAVFGSESECRAASEAFFRQGAAPPATPAPTAAPQAQQSDAKRALALKFVPRLWQQANGDVEKFQQLLSANNLTASLRYDDDDVIPLLGAAAA